MNNQQKQVYYYLLLVQGTYYFFLGIVALSFRLAPIIYLLERSDRSDYLTTLATVMLLGIGISLYLARNIRQNNSSIVLGVTSALPFTLHHSIFLYQFDTSPLLWLDWLVQFSFLLCWIWVLYWKWIDRKFAEL